MHSHSPFHIIGGGLAGSEAAWTLAQAGIPVILHEMRPCRETKAHKTGLCAELVCSNSFRSDDTYANAVGLLHAEMRLANSLILACADNNKVPAGSALAVDRDAFAQEVTTKLENHPLITIKREEIDSIPPEEWGPTLIATGPLTSERLAEEIQNITGKEALAFYDAIAPIIHKESINMDIAWYQSRYDKIGPGGNGKDYINCPLNQEQYFAFVNALQTSEKTELRDFEKAAFFDGCLPIEIMAQRGVETLRHGPMKPMGLTNAHQPDIKAYAVVQLRQDNLLGSLYNMVGFQTKLKYKEQIDIFRTIPGLENAEFARLGGIHRNTYLNSPLVLDPYLRLKNMPRLRFAGQITGCEGYVESAAIGLLSALFIRQDLHQAPPSAPPLTTAFGALLNHITKGHIVNEEEQKKLSFQPMNINFGLFPPIQFHSKSEKRLRGKEKTKAKKHALAERALQDFSHWLKENNF